MTDSILKALDLIDIGANLSHDSFNADFAQILQDAKDKGVANIILTGTCLDSSQAALTLCQLHPSYFYSTAGIHPHEASNFDATARASLFQIAQSETVKAIGETGLDFNRDFSPRPLQEHAFIEQLALAVELQLPVFLHQRDAHARFLPILKEYRDQLSSGVVHCFTGSKAELFDYLDLDMHIGITGWVCDERRGQHLQPLLKEIPKNRLMLETDSPYLLPRTIKPKPKSRRNTPANLVYVLAKVAECLNQPAELVARQTSLNAREFFSINTC